MRYEELYKEISKLKDPGFDLSFQDTEGIKKLVIDPNGIVYLDLYLKHKEDQDNIRKQLAKLIKVDCKFPGLKLNFFESDFHIEETKTNNEKIKYIGIASGKGGVGKSTVTMNIAKMLIKLGKKVGIIDADIYGASIPNFMDLKIVPVGETKDDKIIPLKSKEGIEIISTDFFIPRDKPILWRGPMLGKLLTHFFEGIKWEDDIEYILIDLPPGTGDVSMDINKHVPKSKMIIVTTADPKAATIAVKAGFGALQLGHEILGIVENMSCYINDKYNIKDYIFGCEGGKIVSKKLNVPLLAEIPIGSMNENEYMKIANKIVNEDFK